MDHPAATVASAAGVFAGTNIDDLLILTALFLSGRATGRPRRWQIVTGQYLGVGALVAVSAVAALGLVVIPDRWIGLLGLIPLVLGVRGLLATHRAGGGDTDPPSVATGLLPVAMLTIANGADNIAVYTPVLRGLDPAAGVLTVGVFAVLIAVWCVVAAWLGSHQRVIDVLRRWGHWLVPAVFVVIGLVILAGLVGAT